MKTGRSTVFAIILFAAVFAACKQPVGTESRTYTVTFDRNGGIGTPPDARTVKPGSSITLPDGDGLSKDYFVFDGWTMLINGTVTNYSAGENFTPAGTTTLYARWINTPYTVVTFSANGGIGEVPPAQTVNDGDTITLPGGDGLTKDGYFFGGWNTKNDGTGTNYSAGASYTPTDYIFLYARWTEIPVTYTVTFNANGGSGTIPGETVNDGDTITLPGGDGLTKDGFIVSGWNTSADGTGTYYSIGSSYTPTADITLYARWEEVITLTEKIWADGSITSTASDRAVWYSFDVTNGTTYYVWWNAAYYGDSTKTLWVTANAYYSDGTNIFTDSDNGWSSPQQFTADRSGAVQVRVAPLYGTGTFAIVYSAGSTRPACYTVTFNDNYGSGTVPGPMTVLSPDSSIILPDGDGLSTSDYTFGGWSTGPFGTGTTYKPGDSFTPDNNITLYAVWLNTAGITLDVEHIIDGLPINAHITISRANNDYPVTCPVSVDAADYDAGTGINWEIAGVGVYAGQTVTGSGPSFTLNAGDVRYNSLGAHVLILTVTKNGQQYTLAIPFTIVY